MRVTAPKASARYGDIEIRGIQSVIELEALESVPHTHFNTHSQNSTISGGGRNKTEAVSPSAINHIQSRTAIVVPCKDESLDHIKGVWAAIPASSLIILVSGSDADNYTMERTALTDFCDMSGRRGMAIHQRDPIVAAALQAAGMQDMLDRDGDGLVFKGKGEGLVIGIALAAMATGPSSKSITVCKTDGACGSCGGSKLCTKENKSETTTSSPGCGYQSNVDGDTQFPTTPCDNGASNYRNIQSTNKCQRNTGHTDGAPGYYKYIGFVDADNFVPGSVQEYCRAFSAGMFLADAEDAMVRINWSSKPKVENGKLHFKPSGRSSEIVNRWLNRVLKHMDANISTNEDTCGGDKAMTDLICTGNAGEHAMTISLALKLRVASGYAIEPFHFLDIFERLARQSVVTGASAISDVNKSKVALKIQELSSSAVANLNNHVSELLPMSPDASSIATSPVLSAYGNSTLPTSPSILSAALGKVPTVKQLPGPIKTSALAVAQDKNVADFTPPESPTWSVSPAKVQILQIRTINPHFHDNKGEEHVVRMWKQGLSVIYHSSVVSAFTSLREDLRSAIFGAGESEVGTSTPPFSSNASVATSPSMSEHDTVKNAAVNASTDWQPAKCRIYPTPGSMDLQRFKDELEMKVEEGSFWFSGMETTAGSVHGSLDKTEPVSGLKLDLLGLGPVSREKRPEGDVDDFDACVDEGR